MTTLVIGGTGTVGSNVVRELLERGAKTRALVRDVDKAKFPDGVEAVKGDLTDVDSVRAALDGVSTLFLLNAVTPDELTQALIALNLAREAGVRGYVYLSVIHSDLYTDVPHFSAKYAVERMIEQFDLPATVLRPAYFFQNDLMVKDALLGYGIYPMPVGATGAQMVDVRDIAEVAALHLIRREQSNEPLPRERIDLVGPDLLTGSDLAGIWSEVLGKTIPYAGDDLAGFEQQLRSFGPSWLAYDMGKMMKRIQTDGMKPEAGDIERLTTLLGRPLRSYRAFADEAAQGWA